MRDLKGCVSTLEITVEKLSQKVDDYIAESRANAVRQEARMEKLENRMDSTLKHIQNLTIAAIVGIGAITAAVIAFVATR